MTFATFDIFKLRIGALSKRVLDESRKPGFDYDTVVRLDAEFEALITEMPKEDPVREAQLPHGPHLRWKRITYGLSIAHRLNRLHRPWLARGYAANSPYRFSTQRCLDSARKIVVEQQPILEMTRNVHWLYPHTLSAAVVLFNDLFLWVTNLSYFRLA